VTLRGVFKLLNSSKLPVFFISRSYWNRISHLSTMYAGCRLGLRVTASTATIQIESLLHFKAECGIWVNCKKSPITSPKCCRRMPVIRIGHGSTVPRLMIMFVMEMGCTTSKWWGAVSFQQYNPRLGPFGYADLSIRRAVVFNFRG